jgi:hypothetical protein
MSGSIEAKSIVTEALMLTGRPQSDFPVIFQHLVNGYRELRKYHVENVTYEKTIMDGQKIVEYPKSMVRLLGVYVPMAGEIARLTRKPLVPTVSLMYGKRVRNLEDGEGEPIDVSTQGNRAVSMNNLGYYMEDKENRIIICLTSTRTEVILAYVHSGLDPDNTSISVEYKESLMNYILWRDALMRKDNMNYVAMLEKVYSDGVRMLEKPVISYEDMASVWIVGKTISR